MDNPSQYPLLVFVISFMLRAVVLRARVGLTVRRRPGHTGRRDAPEDFGIILAATLTLLGLIIGFSLDGHKPLRPTQKLRGGSRG